MRFYQRLVTETVSAQAGLLSAPIIARCMSGDITVDDYVAFLCQAYNHVKHTVPLLMAVGARLPDDKEWIRDAVVEYIEEERGHQEWILDDIAACGFDKEAARRRRPDASTELMVAYAYDMIDRVNPLGFFGMVHVLEGTSAGLALNAASSIAKALQLPESACTYLLSHGELDQEHTRFFAGLMDRIEERVDQDQIVHSTNMFYHLYGNVFRGLQSDHGIPRRV